MAVRLWVQSIHPGPYICPQCLTSATGYRVCDSDQVRHFVRHFIEFIGTGSDIGRPFTVHLSYESYTGNVDLCWRARKQAERPC